MTPKYLKKTMLQKGLLAGGIFAAMLQPVAAHAHFLWAEVSSDAQPVAKIAFAEGSGEVSDGALVERIEVAKAWNNDGKDLTLKTGGGVRSGELQGAKAFGASQTWGVVDKGGAVFNLQYWAKAAASVDQAGQNVKLPLELFASRDGKDGVVATLKRGKTVVPEANVTVHVPNEEKPKILVTDKKGQIHFEAKEAGLYGLRTNWNDNTPGEAQGKKYPETRNYTTLSFRVGSEAPKGGEIPKTGEASMGQGSRPTLPPGPNPKADMEAYKLLEGAHGNRQTMPENFPGFTAKVIYNSNGKTSVGQLTYRRKGKTDIEFPNAEKADQEWIQEKLLNLLGHRRGGSFAEGDGRWPLTFSKLPENSFGKLIVLNDGMKSEYRVKDKEVTEVTRQMGNTRFTISVLETMPTDGGKYLANHFIVSYRDATTGDLKQLEGYRDSYSKIDGVWLPTARYVFTTGGIKPGDADTPSMQVLRLTDIKALKADTLAAAPQN